MNTMSDEKIQYRTCHHILPEGNLCLSPALKTSLYCYYHNRERQRQRNLAHAADLRRANTGASPDQLEADIMQSLGLPDLEDARSLQIALSTIVRAVTFGHLNTTRAAIALRGLRTAVHNFKNVHRRAYSNTVVIEDPDPIYPLISPSAPDPWEFPAEDPQEEEESETGNGNPQTSDEERETRNEERSIA